MLRSGQNKSVPLTPERIAQLEALNFEWDARDPSQRCWEERYQELLDFKEKHGSTLVPMNFKENPKLATWVSSQRQEYKQYQRGNMSRLDTDKVQRLNSVGFVWVATRGRRKLPNPAAVTRARQRSENDQSEAATTTDHPSATAVQAGAATQRLSSDPAPAPTAEEGTSKTGTFNALGLPEGIAQVLRQAGQGTKLQGTQSAEVSSTVARESTSGSSAGPNQDQIASLASLASAAMADQPSIGGASNNILTQLAATINQPPSTTPEAQRANASIESAMVGAPSSQQDIVAQLVGAPSAAQQALLAHLTTNASNEPPLTGSTGQQGVLAQLSWALNQPSAVEQQGILAQLAALANTRTATSTTEKLQSRRQEQHEPATPPAPEASEWRDLLVQLATSLNQRPGGASAGQQDSLVQLATALSQRPGAGHQDLLPQLAAALNQRHAGESSEQQNISAQMAPAAQNRRAASATIGHQDLFAQLAHAVNESLATPESTGQQALLVQLATALNTNSSSSSLGPQQRQEDLLAQLTTINAIHHTPTGSTTGLDEILTQLSAAATPRPVNSSSGDLLAQLTSSDANQSNLSAALNRHSGNQHGSGLLNQSSLQDALGSASRSALQVEGLSTGQLSAGPTTAQQDRRIVEALAGLGGTRPDDITATLAGLVQAGVDISALAQSLQREGTALSAPNESSSGNSLSRQGAPFGVQQPSPFVQSAGTATHGANDSRQLITAVGSSVLGLASTGNGTAVEGAKQQPELASLLRQLVGNNTPQQVSQTSTPRNPPPAAQSGNQTSPMAARTGISTAAASKSALENLLNGLMVAGQSTGLSEEQLMDVVRLYSSELEPNSAVRDALSSASSVSEALQALQGDIVRQILPQHAVLGPQERQGVEDRLRAVLPSISQSMIQQATGHHALPAQRVPAAVADTSRTNEAHAIAAALQGLFSAASNQGIPRQREDRNDDPPDDDRKMPAAKRPRR